MDDYDKKLKAFIIQTLRRASYRWPARSEAMRLARLERGLYQCANCKGTFRNKEINIDHKDPVVSLDGFTNFDDYIKRMFCDASGLQILCTSCHDTKTEIEKKIRKINRDKKKPVAKRKKKE